MCDWTPVRNWLIGIAAAIFVAAAIAVGAALVNNTYWYSWLAPVGMIVAAAATGGAILLCGAAITALDTFCACAGERCGGACTNLRNVLNAARVVLGIQATACLTSALSAWIPGIGAVPIWIIVGALIVQAALIISAIAFMVTLSNCQATSPGSAPRAPGGPPVGTGPIG